MWQSRGRRRPPQYVRYVLILVADGNKLGTQSFREFATLADVDVFVTDVMLEDSMREFERNDVPVVDNQVLGE